ncbi:MAG: SHOCT domain-containing protein [Theionarchaea archaeon]|nr:SHOCT domain-containing protein [Theionarchaea archaeon]
MKKGTVVFFGLLLCLVPTAAQPELPFSETIEIKNFDDQYSLDLILPVYVKKESTYEIEERMVQIRIGPKDYARIAVGNEDYFLKVLVSVTLSDIRGTVSEDFESYLNCELENCDETFRTEQLFWDHTGEERADRAGEPFEENLPLVVRDKYVEVTVRLVSYLAPLNVHSCDSRTEYCESDVECVLYLWGMTLQVTVDYSSTQASYQSSLEEASDCISRGDGFREAGEFEKAVSEYEKAQAVYGKLGDTLRSNALQEQIDQINLEKAEAYGVSGDTFLEAGEFDKALVEYEKAEEIYATIGDEENLDSIKGLIEMCRLYQEAEEALQGSIQAFEEAETAENKWRALAIYRKARSHFADAKIMFDQLEDSEKLEECNDWINRCDTEIERITATEIGEPSISLVWYTALAIGIGVGMVVVVVILKYRPTESKPGKSELEILESRLATGEITIEEYERLKHDLEK